MGPGKILLKINTILLLLLTPLYGCGNGSVQVRLGRSSGGAPPAIVSTTPENGASGVPASSVITISFSQDMDPSTINETTFFVTGPGKARLAGAIGTSGRTSVFRPARAFPFSSTFSVTITSGARDSSGTPLTADFVLSFTTESEPDLLVPSVVSAKPLNGVAAVPVNSDISVTFSEPVDPATVNTGSLKIKNGAGVPMPGSVSSSGAASTFTHSLPFSYSTSYTAEVTTAVKDLAGNPLPSPYLWNFTTEAAPDTTGPSVLTTAPPGGGRNAPIVPVVSAVFSEPVDPASVNGSTFVLKDPGGGVIAGRINTSVNTASFTPLSPLAFNSTYTAEIAGVKDLAGNLMPAPHAWGFTTVQTTNISGGRLHSLALKGDGTVWGWGGNGSGQIGDGTGVDKTAPVQSGISNILSIKAGEFHTIAVKPDGTVWAWGRNDFGQVGDGTTTDRVLPSQVPGFGGAIAAEGGLGTHSSALKSDGTVWAWGNNGFGQLGDGTTAARHTPGQVSGLTNIVSISEGWSHTIAVRGDGTLWAWGRDTEGQLGDNSTIDSPLPLQVSGLAGVAQIAAGGRHNLALKSDGTLWAWGWNGSGQIGDGTLTDRHTPVKLQSLTGVVAIAAGYSHSVALKSDGTVWAWGDNTFSQLGTGVTGNSSPAPVHINGLSGIIAIASGWSHVLALKNDGSLWAVGYNYYGQLGDGTHSTSAVPVRVTGF